MYPIVGLDAPESKVNSLYLDSFEHRASGEYHVSSIIAGSLTEIPTDTIKTILPPTMSAVSVSNLKIYRDGTVYCSAQERR